MADPHDNERGSFRKDKNGNVVPWVGTNKRIDANARRDEKKDIKKANKNKFQDELDLDFSGGGRLNLEQFEGRIRMARSEHMRMYMDDWTAAPPGQKPDYDAHWEEHGWKP